MLIEFRVTNYRSLRETQVLSMVAGTGKEHLETHTSDSGAPEIGRLLRSAVVYGPNAAGKTNLLRALQFMQAFVINSAELSFEAQNPYDPFKLSSASREAPSEFEVAFMQDGTRYEYGFAVDKSRITQEWLMEYPKGRGRRIFDRRYDNKKDQYDWTFSSFLKGQRASWKASTRSKALFLSTAIQLNSSQLLPVYDWFKKRLVVIVGISFMNPALTLKLLDQSDGKSRILPFLRVADVGINDLEITREPLPAGAIVFGGSQIVEQKANSPIQNIVKITLSHWANDRSERVPIDLMDESSGTQVLFRSAGAWLNVFENGEILLFDEIDTSLHPLLARYLIDRFHSDETNRNNAQLIFSTHNTSLLNQELFRRDQIWFAEKNASNETKIFPLMEFSPRNDEVVEKWYLRGRYGALPVITEFEI